MIRDALGRKRHGSEHARRLGQRDNIIANTEELVTDGEDGIGLHQLESNPAKRGDGKRLSRLFDVEGLSQIQKFSIKIIPSAESGAPVGKNARVCRRFASFVPLAKIRLRPTKLRETVQS